MDSAERVRSHSWWWNSHISPKNSKWLQESLADMNSKVNEMLKIIEEDGDSFGQRAEMYYKRRPELINLVEEFYRSYRALAERYDSITGELRQNIVHCAHSSTDSSQKTGVDVHRKKGLDGFDSLMVSLSQSLSMFDYDDDVDSEVSSKEIKLPFDYVGAFPAQMEAESEGDNSNLLPELLQESKTRKNSNETNMLQQEYQQLVEENKQLKLMALTHAGQTNTYEFELSEMQKQIKNLEDEGKQIRDRLQVALEQENILGTENLKLSHLQSALEEEKAEMAVLYERSRKDYQVASKQLKDLEEALFRLKHKTSEEASAGAENMRRLEEESQKLHSIILTVNQEKKDKEMELQGYAQQLQVVEKELLDLQVKCSHLQVESSGMKRDFASKNAYIEKLQKQVLEWQYIRISLDGEVSAKEAADEKLRDKLKIAVEQTQKLEAEIQHLEHTLHCVHSAECNARGLKKEILQLQQENVVLENTRLDGILHITKLKNELQGCKWERNILETEVSCYKEQFSELSTCKEQKQILTNNLAASMIKLNKAKEEIIVLQECNCLIEKELSMQLIIVSMQEEENSNLQEENMKLATKLEGKTKKLQEYEGNILELHPFLRSQKTSNLEQQIEKFARMTEDYNALVENLKQLNVNLSQLEEENEHIRMESSVRMTILDHLVTDVAQLNQEKHALSLELELMVQEAASLQKHLTKQAKEKEDVGEELQAGLGKIKLLEEKIVMFEQETNKLREENRRLAETSSSFEECHKDNQKKLSQAEVEVDFLRNVNMQKHVELAGRVEAIEKLEGEINKLLGERETLKDQVLSNKIIMNELKEEIKKLQEDRNQLSLAIQQKVAELQHQDTLIQLLHIRGFQTKEENESLKDISRIGSEWQSIGNNVRELVEELNNLKSQKIHHEDKHLERMVHEKELAEEVCRLQIEKKILLEEKSSDTKKLQLQQGEFHELQQEENMLKDNLQVKENEIKMLQLDIEKLEQSLSSTKQNNFILKKWIERDVEDYTSIRDSVAKMQEDLLELEKEKAKFQLDAEAAEAFNLELKEAVSTLQNQKTFLDKAIILKEKEISMLQEEAKTHSEIERQLKESATEIVTLKNGKQVQEIKINKLLAQLSSLEQENVKFNEKCQKQEEALQSKDGLIQEMEMEMLALHNIVFTVAEDGIDLKDKSQSNFKRKQVIDLMEELLRLEKEEKRLVANLEKDAFYIFKLEEKLSRFNEENHVLTDKLSKSIDQCTVLEAKVAKLEEDLSVMRQKNTNLEGEISSFVAHGKEIEVIMFSQIHDMLHCEETVSATASCDCLGKVKEECTLLQKNDMLRSETLNFESHVVREKRWGEQIHQLQAISNFLKVELASRLARISQLEEEKEISQKEKKKVDELLISKEKEIKALHEDLSILQEKRNVVESILTADQEVEETAMVVTYQIQRRIKDYEREISILKKQMCNLHGQNSHLETNGISIEVKKREEGTFSNTSVLYEDELLPLHKRRDSTRLNNKLEVQETGITDQVEVQFGMEKGMKLSTDESSVIYSMHHQHANTMDDCHNLVEAAASSGIGKDLSVESTASHVNLGNKLQQEITDEKMQQQVYQLQAEQKRLRLRLQLWMERKDDLLDEIEKILNLMASPTEKHGEETFKECQELSKHSRVNTRFRDLEGRIMLLQERKDTVSVELKTDVKEARRIRKELINLVEQERASSSFETWEVKISRFHAEIQRLKKRNEKQFDVFWELDEHIQKIQMETERVVNRVMRENAFPSLQYYKPFSLIRRYNGKTFSWLDNIRSIKMPEGHGSGKASSIAKKCCRCCILMNPNEVAE